MVERTGYEPGTPCWIDLATSDPEKSVAFYEALFGWEGREMPGGGHTMFNRGKKVCAIGPPMAPGQPVQWRTYISVSDADETAAKVTAAGGRVLGPVIDVLDRGRMAACLDNDGAPFSIWQPRANFGAEVINEPISLVWNELNTRDVEASKAFYAAVFGWRGATVQTGPTTHTTWINGDGPVGGMAELKATYPPEVPPFWSVVLAADDPDAIAAAVGPLGGTVTIPPTEVDIGRLTEITDPHGARLRLLHVTRVGRPSS